MQLQRLSMPLAAAFGSPAGAPRLQPPPLARPRAPHHICWSSTSSSSSSFFGDAPSQADLQQASGTAPSSTEAGRAYWRTLWESRTAVKNSAAAAASAAAEEGVSSSGSTAAAADLSRASSPSTDPASAERPPLGSRESSSPVPSSRASGGGGGEEAAAQGDVLIELRDVAKAFGNKTILSKASFKIRRGEAIGVIGGSGTGKSTTLRLMAGLLEPDSGQVIVKGVPRKGLLSDDAPATATSLHIGMVFQSGALFDSLTVGENVGFLLYEHSDLPQDTVKRLVAKALGQVGLSGVEDLYPSELSGGMKKRVALARAIIRDDENDNTEQVIMYDEPTAGLDPVASTVVEDLIRSLHVKENGNGTMAAGISAYIVVTHQHSTIRRSVDKLVFLHEGTVVWEGSVEEFETSEEPIVKQFRTGSLKGPIEYV